MSLYDLEIGILNEVARAKTITHISIFSIGIRQTTFITKVATDDNEDGIIDGAQVLITTATL